MDKSKNIKQDFKFESQDEIDQFSKKYPNCQFIKGDVIISELNEGGIKNLKTFSNLRKIQGHLRIINNSKLIDLTGFHHVDTIIGTIEIFNNTSLKKLNFNNLVFVNGEFTIGKYVHAENLSGLENLRSVGKLRLGGNSIKTLKGLENLTDVGSGLWCWNNPELRSIEILNNVEKFTFVQLVNNPKLTSCVVNAICDLNRSNPESIYWLNNGNDCSLQNCEN